MSDLYVIDERPRRRVPSWVWAVAIVVLLLVGMLTWWGLRQRADEAATQRIETVLASVGATNVAVSVSGGDATLTGTLPPGMNAEQLKDQVAQVEGVNAVITDVDPAMAGPAAPVAPAPTVPNTEPAGDSPTTAAAASLDVQVLPDRVILSGNVPSDQIKDQIGQAASKVHGTQTVTNNLQVDQNASPTGLQHVSELFTALGERSAVAINLHDGNISMDGTVKDEPARTASAKVAAGITGDPDKVTNNLVVGYATKYSTSEAQLALNNLPTINFYKGGTALSVEAKKTLAQAAKIIKDNPSAGKIEVESHTHGDVHPAQTKQLTQQRAEAAVRELVRLGVPAARLSPEGLGETRPLVSNDTPNHDAINSRMQFEIEG